MRGARAEPVLSVPGPMRQPDDRLWHWMASKVDSRIGLRRWGSRDDLDLLVTRRQRWMASVSLGGHGCWNWHARFGGSDGSVPLFSEPRTAFQAFVVLWMPELGRQLEGPKRRMSRVTCGNSRCVNPRHRVSTTALRDYKIPVWNRGMEPDQVREIRALRAGGETLRSLAQKFGVSYGTIADVCSGRSYRWVQ